MTKPIVFFDIDGTILNHDKVIPESTKQAITELQNKDIHVAIATGRAPFMFKDIREELNINSFVSLNGQYAEFEGEAIHTHALHPEQLHLFSKKAKELDIPLIYLNNETMKASTDAHPHIKEAMSSIKMFHPEVEHDFYNGRDIYQVLLFCEEQKESSLTEGFEQFNFIRWHEYSSDVLPVGGSKANGIQQMVNHLGFNMENVFAFGDGLNDLEMIEKVGTGIAMGNAVEPLKKLANHVTTNVDEDGILNGLKWAGLL
ncbi:Cof-type HAD-IIB family hydrolase [Gottfriedia luciferensis]|uniref:Cof-type HAD-IIB family hydrolase n=1 Tax=Gottfriedia luciferensis TaxID=178774 RepID=UPI000B445A32|nr:Cof-type HAD-IIB family hydrolase [Gottfriedia luciferensis]